MEKDVEADPSFGDADTFGGIAEELFRRRSVLPCGIRAVPVDANPADLRRALDILFGNVREGGFCKFRHSPLEEARHDGSLCKQALCMLVVDRVLVKRRMVLGRGSFILLHGVTFLAFIIASNVPSSQWNANAAGKMERYVGLCGIFDGNILRYGKVWFMFFDVNYTHKCPLCGQKCAALT